MKARCLPSPRRIVRLAGSHHVHGDNAAVGRAVAHFIDGQGSL